MTTEAATRALVVEDDPNIVDLIRSNLAVRGFDTIVSADGLRALRLLETDDSRPLIVTQPRAGYRLAPE